MTGADEAHYRAASKTSSRLIPFPDHVSRLITLEQRHWDTMDRLHSQEIWPAHEPAATAIDHVKESITDPGEIEPQLRYWFRLLIEAAMPDVTGPGEWVVANEALPARRPRPLCEVFSDVACDQPGGHAWHIPR